ncbi:MAG: hypothetical protein CVT49_05495 [candidate division Zixibacteria bacterium HGW-Zixibacteria-1]|nr:MAG: hypothetical protein CVT49_05495 [candidate division Zixibacteria bacterium HGW-Zixibacteria-1]
MLQNKLGRFSRHIVNSPENSGEKVSGSRYQKLAECLDGDLMRHSNGTFIKIINRFDEDYFHGKHMMPDRNRLPIFRKKYFENADESITLDPEKFLFFDTETTGLGGSGTVAFLIGFGSLKDNGFEVRQYFLPDFPDEEAMLEAVRAEIRPDTVLVSYNGRAFDIPIISDRMIIQRVERNLEYADHIDLLHTVRRLHRRRIKKCNLGNVEQQILDFYRQDDIPGYLVPSMYFNWLASDDTYQMDLIAEHNLNDIVSLYFIMCHIAAIHEAPSEKISDPDDVLSLARIMERRREHGDVCRFLEEFDELSHSYDRFDILFLQSLSYKRNGDYEKAVVLWEEIAARAVEESFWSGIELAKFYEHKAGDFQRALEYTLKAKSVRPPRDSALTDIQKRIRRLNQKIARRESSK